MEWVRGLPAATVYILDVQPVVPIKLTHDWNLITRTIVSIINWVSDRPSRCRPRPTGAWALASSAWAPLRWDSSWVDRGWLVPSTET